MKDYISNVCKRINYYYIWFEYVEKKKKIIIKKYLFMKDFFNKKFQC